MYKIPTNETVINALKLKQETEEKQKFKALQKLGNDQFLYGKILHDYRTETTRRTILEIIESKKYCVVYMKLGNYEAVYFAQNELTLLLNHF